MTMGSLLMTTLIIMNYYYAVRYIVRKVSGFYVSAKCGVALAHGALVNTKANPLKLK